MPKQGENPLWDYFKISNEDVSIAICILCKNNLSRGSKDPHKPKLQLRQNSGFGTSLIFSTKSKIKNCESLF